MSTIKKLAQLFILLALLAGGLSFNIHPAVAADTNPEYVCLPTCEENDARMLTVAGISLSTMADQPVRLSFASPAGAPSIEIGIFDGDSSNMWDHTSQPQILRFTLYADPLGTYDKTQEIGSWLGNTMPDNDWFTISIPNLPEARSPSGNFIYHMEVSPTIASLKYQSNFKVRTDGYESLIAQPFSFLATLMSRADRSVVYPLYPDLSVTTYDGTFDFYVYAPVDRQDFAVWDGDVDFGSADLSIKDTDDLDTPNDVLPPWVLVPESMNLEGIAVGSNGSTGNPPDDYSSIPLVLRSPSVQYRVTIPGNGTFLNENPSGNKEWEQFLISSDPDSLADVHIPEQIPAGVYRIQFIGLDLGNLNALRLEYESLGVCAKQPTQDNPMPCKQPLYPYVIGDTLFADLNNNGIQDNGEVGLPGVLVALQDESGQPHLDVFGNPITAITDANGNYSFNVDGYRTDAYTGEVTNDGVYAVNVDVSNFMPGGVLENWISTTGGNGQINTVIDSSVLTYDFGYRYGVEVTNPGTGTIGYWKNHPEAWPVQSLEVGGITYTRDQAIDMLKTPTRKDKTIDLFSQLVAAKLNIIIGNANTCILPSIIMADQWLVTHPWGSKVSAGSTAWQSISSTFTSLDGYNNGRMCALHRG